MSCTCSQGQESHTSDPQPPNEPTSTENNTVTGIPSNMNLAWLTEFLYASNLLADTILNDPATLQEIRSAPQATTEVPRIELERSLGRVIYESVIEVVPAGLGADDGDWRDHPLNSGDHERMERVANELKRRLRLKLARIFAVDEEAATLEGVEDPENPHAS